MVNVRRRVCNPTERRFALIESGALGFSSLTFVLLVLGAEAHYSRCRMLNVECLTKTGRGIPEAIEHPFAPDDADINDKARVQSC